MYDYTSNSWSQWNSNEKLEEKFGNCTRKTLDRFTTKDSYTWNITHNTESTAVWSLNPERWGSTLVQEKYQEEKVCDKRHPYCIIIIIIIILLITQFSTYCEITIKLTLREEIWIKFCTKMKSDFPHNYYNPFHYSPVSRYGKVYLPLQLLFIPSRYAKLRNYITYSFTSCLDKFFQNIANIWGFTHVYNFSTQSQSRRQWAHLR